MRKAKPKIIILLLMLLCLLATTAKALPPGGVVGSAGGKAAGAVGTGYQVSSNSGIRIYVIDENGNRCSSVADILQPMTPQGSMASGWTLIVNPRFTDGFAPYDFNGYSESTLWTPYMWREKLGSVVYSAFTKTEIAPNSRDFIYDGVNVHISSAHTKLAPAANDKDSKRGKEIKSYLQGDSSAPKLEQQPLAGSDEVLEPVYANSQLQTLFDATDNNGNTVIGLSFPPVINPVDGKPDFIQTLAANKCTVCIEPIYFGVYERYDGKRTANVILGTPYNTFQFIDSGMWTPDDAYNGNSSVCTNNSIPWSMYLDKDLKIKGTTKISANTFTVDKVIEQANLRWGGVGYGFMYFTFSSSGSSTQTYDHNPDPNPVPHKAPDPPSTATKEEKKYQIVKTYMVEQSDGTRTHVSTHAKIETVPTISIMQEPDYKVVEYFTSPEYYFGVHPEADITSSLWETMKGEEHTKGLITTYHTMTFDQSKSGWPEAKQLVGSGAGWENPVRIGTVCSCADKKHKDDTTLYVLLVKKESIPKTSTTPISPTPPADPHGPPEPLKPGENPKDPETDYQNPSDPSEYTHFRIVKVYETELEKLDHTKEIIVDGDYTIFPTNPLVKIEEEGEGAKYSKAEQYYLTAWKVSDEYPYGGPTSTESVPSNTKYDDISVSVKKSGTGTTTVDLTEGLPDAKDKSKVVTLYVRLLRKQKEKPTVNGDIIIQESQISKTIHTNDKNIGGTFGNYSWSVSMPGLQTVHMGDCGGCVCCCPGHVWYDSDGGSHFYKDNCTCNVHHPCSMDMYGVSAERNIDFWFKQFGQDALEIPDSIKSQENRLAPKLYMQGHQYDYTAGIHENDPNVGGGLVMEEKTSTSSQTLTYSGDGMDKNVGR